jgi:hypothetical protein
MNHLRPYPIIIALLAAQVPVPGAAQHPAGFIRMPSGDSLPVWGFELYRVKNQPPALVLHYETRLDLHDSAAVRGEILAIWPGFRPAAEQRGVERAAIRALRFQAGVRLASLPQDLWHRDADLYGIVFTRGSDGLWSVLGDSTALH